VYLVFVKSKEEREYDQRTCKHINTQLNNTHQNLAAIAEILAIDEENQIGRVHNKCNSTWIQIAKLSNTKMYISNTRNQLTPENPRIIH